jgi:hypothetical protein
MHPYSSPLKTTAPAGNYSRKCGHFGRQATNIFNVPTKKLETE